MTPRLSVSALTLEISLFCCLFNAMFFTCLGGWIFCWWLCYLKWLPSVVLKCCLVFPKHERAVLCLTEEICVLDELHSGMASSAVGREFNVDESAIYIK